MIVTERSNESYVVMAQLQILKLLVDNPDLHLKGITGASFPQSKFESVYEAIRNLRDAGEDINPTSLFREANKLNDQIDIYTINNVFEQKVSKSNLDGALSVLYGASIKHRINNLTDKIKEVASSNNPVDIPALTMYEYEMQEILSSTYNTSESKDFSRLFDDYIGELSERKKGLTFPFNDTFLDTHLAKKAAPGQIITIAGATGTGKSIYGLHLMNGLVNTDVPCMYFSPEMDEMSTMDRWMAMRNALTIDKLYSVGNDMDGIIKIAQQQKEDLKDKPFRFIDSTSIALDKIRYYIKEFKLAYNVKYLIVFIDLLTQVQEFIETKGKSGTNLPILIEQGINKMNGIAKEENVCIVGIVQVNRETDSAKVRTIEDLQLLRPTKNNIKNASAIAERSRTVLSVFRAKHYADQFLKDDPEAQFIPDILETQVLKQNMGRVGDIGKYNFNGPTFTLHELIEEKEGE